MGWWWASRHRGGGGAADIDQVGEQDRQRLRDGQIVGTEAQRDDVIVTVYLLGGHYRDPGQLLAVAEQEGAGDPVGELQVSSWRRRAIRAQRVSGSVAVRSSPGPARAAPGQWWCSAAQSRKSRTGAGRALGKPGVDIALAALGQRGAGLVEPGEEPGGAQQLGAGVAGGGPSAVAPLGAGADAGPARWRRRAAADDARAAALR